MAKTWKKLTARITALEAKFAGMFTAAPEKPAKAKTKKKAKKTAGKAVKKPAKKSARKAAAAAKPVAATKAVKPAATPKSVRKAPARTKKINSVKLKRVPPPPAQELLPTGEPMFVTPMDKL